MDREAPEGVRTDMKAKCPIVDDEAILRASWLTHLPHEEAVQVIADEGWPLAIADLIVVAGSMLNEARPKVPESIAPESMTMSG